MKAEAISKYEKQLHEMRSRLTHEIFGVSDTVAEDVQAPGDLSHVPTHLADRDVEGVDAELSIEEAKKHILHQVDAALERIERGDFGKCTDCQQEISEERLELVPYTPHCVPCEEKHERGS